MPGLLSEDPADGEDTAGDVTPEDTQQDAAPELPKEEPGTKVVLKPSRREQQKKATEEHTKKLDSVLEAVGKFSGELSARDQAIAQLRGQLEAYATRPAYQEPARPAAPAVNPDELLEKANALLDKQDFRGYQRTYAEYVRATLPPQEATQQQAYQPQQQMSPQTIALMGAYPDVSTHPQGLHLAVAEDNRLAAMGHQPGPQRFLAAFEAARATLKGQQKPNGPQFSQQSAAVLAGVPTARPSGGSGGGEVVGPGVVLTEHEKRIAKAAGMDLDEYARDIYAHHKDRRV